MALFGWVSSLLTIIWRNLTLLGFSLILFAFAFDFMKRRRSWNHPPGPVSLPFIGTMLFLDFNNFHLSLTQRKDDVNSRFNDQNLTLVITELFAAGTETTATTLRWGLLFMILYPNVQTKVQEEIDEVIGKNRPPNMEDQANMHYTRAVIHEIQRFGNILPVGIPHMTYRDTELEGFFIPKGTTVIINLSSVLKEEAMRENPQEFYPEHFLDKNGHFVKQEAFLPFSAGQRACLGEQLARMELFLFFTSLLQRFTLHIPKDQPRPREDGCFTFTLIPHPYQIQAVSRGLH